MNALKLWIQLHISNAVRRYNHKRYWSLRTRAFHSNKFIQLLISIYLKRVEQKSGAFIGLDFNYDNNIKKPPILVHGLLGIFIVRNARIGEGCTIMQHVTIGKSKGEAPVIGDDVFIGAGAKIIGKTIIGNNVRIGAGCVIVDQIIPDNCTVVLDKPRIINKSGDYRYTLNK